jgi:uncharacterized membrane protein YoaK (UPF0700 family)
MNETSGGGTAFRISIGLAFIGGYADASSFVLARTLTGHLTGNCVLAAVSAAGKDWYLTLDRLLAVIAFLGGILVSLILNRFASARLRPSSLAIAMLIELLLFLSASLFVSKGANELFIVCMCLALGIQNGALHRTNGISVHSTFMTGMVTTLLHKSFDHFLQRGVRKRTLQNNRLALLSEFWRRCGSVLLLGRLRAQGWLHPSRALVCWESCWS